MLMLQPLLLLVRLFLLTFELSSRVWAFRLSLMCPVVIMDLFTGWLRKILWAWTHNSILKSRRSPRTTASSSPPPSVTIETITKKKIFYCHRTSVVQGQMEAQSWPPLWADLACFWMVMGLEDPEETNTHTHTRRDRPSVQKGLLELGRNPRPARSEEMELIIIKAQTNPVGSRGQEVYPRLNEEQVLFKLIKVNQ